MTGFSAAVGDVTTRLDHYGKPAWIALTVLGFILFWPIGLALLFFTIWSGRMGCGAYARQGAWDDRFAGRRDRWERKMARMQEKMARWGGGPRHGFAPTGNRAFDEYRDQTLQRLEDEAQEFQDYLARLRAARDKQEFDQYMAERQSRNASPANRPDEGPSPQPPHAG
ncbi:MAG: DUF2852 domain-containing protein [Rhizobiales bacterium]|nr:DUF2852 domain-containing protein [Hyphomicrobiales bacterium]